MAINIPAAVVINALEIPGHKFVKSIMTS